MKNDNDFGLPDVSHTPPIPGYVRPPKKLHKQTCENCKFSSHKGMNSGYVTCYRYPPTWMHNVDGHGFSVSGENDWCGEYRDREG